MTKPVHALLLAATIAALSLAAPTLAHAQSADLVLCDRLAADPADPDKPADVKGVPDIAASDIATAIKYCRVAAGSSRRAMYQLGRAYAADRHMPEAIAAWRKAADKGSTSAMVELGVLYGTGAGVARGRRAGAQAVRARRRSRQSARSHQSCRTRRRWRRVVGPGCGGASCWRKLRRPTPKRSTTGIDDGRRHRRRQGRCRRAQHVRKGRRAKSPRRAGADGRLHARGPRRAEGCIAPRPITSGPPRSATRMPRRRSSASNVPTSSRISAETW